MYYLKDIDEFNVSLLKIPLEVRKVFCNTIHFFGFRLIDSHNPQTATSLNQVLTHDSIFGQVRICTLIKTKSDSDQWMARL